VVVNTELSLATIYGHVDTADPFDEIRLRLFSPRRGAGGLPTIG
jgi:hypothetical protein